jgi:hypothetical protein
VRRHEEPDELFTLHVDARRWNGHRTTDATALALWSVARQSARHNEDHGGVFMIRRFWPVLVVLVLACAAAAALRLRTPAPLPVAAVGQEVEAAPAPPMKPATPAKPATEAIDASAREPAGYDHYRAEMKRIRAEREKAQALEANERCIGGERYRKVGSAWERAGNC